MEELKVLNEQKKALLPENAPQSPKAEEAPKTNGSVKMTDADESLHEETAEEAADSDDDLSLRRNTRRGGDRAVVQRKQKEREEEQKRKEAEAAAAKQPKQSKQFIKLLKDIQKKEEYIKKCEDEVVVIDNDLREADCARTRVLGKDRFWNRYYWFERNGMPYTGLPTSSTAESGYANGCIWVQGPDDLEREGYIDMAPELQAEYKQKFKITVSQRKKMEEGRTSVFTAHQWGYYSEPNDVESLLNWLDPRGFNELKLRKELITCKEKIIAGMEARAQYLAADEEEAAEKEKEEQQPKESKRMSTRAKNQPSPEPEPQHRCLSWYNSMAIDEIGHIHSEEPVPQEKKGRKAGRKSKG